MSQSVGENLPFLLRQLGVDVVFGLPGVHTLEFFRAMNEAGLRHVGVRHEQGAGFMADGYARSSGRPGVCLVISGPGVTNIATPLGQAYSDSIPVLALSSVNAIGDLGMGRGMLHDVTDQRQATAPVTTLSATVLSPDQVPVLLERAFAYFSSQRPRPHHLSFPLDLLTRPASARALNPPKLSAPAAAPELIDALAHLLGEAQRPVLVAGGGTIHAGQEIVALAEKLSLPVATTIAAKGVIPDDHPLSLSSTLQRPEARKLIAGADLVIVVGSELSEADLYVTADSEKTGGGDALTHGKLDVTGKLVRIDLDPVVLAGDYPAALSILADSALTLRALLAKLESKIRPRDDLKHLRRAMRSAVTPLEAKHIKVLDTVRKALPENGFIFGDMTQIAYTGCVHFETRKARSWFFPMGYGTMGYALPAAIGAKLANPDRPGVVLAGDGGLLFTIQELATAVELELPLAIVLWNNDGLGEIKDFMQARGLPLISVKPRNPDFIALAKSFGCDALRAQSLVELQDSIEAAFTKRCPTLIEVREDAAYLA
ncbi:5-guanidino-2-oxopentanoate decarboxylase [Taklimakanibacter deserti]|uniref:5-guanidino-2-oxopentanoate decarboxylase n=1 Tax=Taklimakanibacter deserti TaxID=2267839 RepID=UPI0034D4060D